MAFLIPEELKTVLYEYQTDSITEFDNDIVLSSIDAALEECRSYLAGLYDVTTIFAATGTARNALLLEYAKSITVWYLIRLSNPDQSWEQAKDRYDRAIKWLKDVRDGKLSPTLPRVTMPPDGEVVGKIKFISNKKFNHSY